MRTEVSYKVFVETPAGERKLVPFSLQVEGDKHFIVLDKLESLAPGEELIVTYVVGRPER